MDVALPIGLAGIWVFLFARQLRSARCCRSTIRSSRRRSRMTPTDPATRILRDAELHNPDVAHESTDVNIRTRAGIRGRHGGARRVLGGVDGARCSASCRIPGGRERSAGCRRLRFQPVKNPGGEPNLLTNEPAEPAQIPAGGSQEHWKATAGSMGRAGVARVPIESGQEVDRSSVGCRCARAAAVEDASAGTHAPAYGEASGGRTIPVPKAALCHHSHPRQPQAPAPAAGGEKE